MNPSDRIEILDEDEYFNPNLSNLQHAAINLSKGFTRMLWTARKIAATKKRSDSHSVIVPLSTDEVKEVLRENEYEPGWWLSYSFRGEVVNRRRPIYHPSEYAKWWQAHVRGYEMTDDDPRFDDPRIADFNRNSDYQSIRDSSELTDLTCHIEPEPKEHPDIHLKYVKYNTGTKLLLKLLERIDVSYVFVPEHLQSAPQPDLTRDRIEIPERRSD